MKKIFDMEGTATLIISDNEYALKIRIDLQENKYFQFIGIADKSISESENTNNVALKNIILKDYKEKIYINALEENIFIKKIEENYTRFTFCFRNGYLNLHQKNYYNCDFFIYNNFVMPIHTLEITYKEIFIQQSPLNSSFISITSKKNQKIEKKIIENIVISLELLQGQSLTKFSENCFGDVKISIGERKAITSKCDSILSSCCFINTYLNEVLNFLDKISEVERKKWLRAFRLFISYKRVQSTEFLLFYLHFFEIFKNKKNYKIALIEEFLIPKEEAILITKIRNDLVHEGLYLDESIEKNLASSEIGESFLKELLNKTNDINKKSIIFAFYIEEIITKYINKNIFEDSYDKQIEDNMRDFPSIYDQLIKPEIL